MEPLYLYLHNISDVLLCGQEANKNFDGGFATVLCIGVRKKKETDEKKEGKVEKKNI